MPKKVYLGMIGDIMHPGLINIINEGAKYGDVMIGLFTDKAIATHKRLPYLTYEQRKNVIENIKGVSEIVPQDEWSYIPNLMKYKPNYIIHGDDWLVGPDKYIRDEVFKLMEKQGGQVIEIPYTKGITSSGLASEIAALGATTDALAISAELAGTQINVFLGGMQKDTKAVAELLGVSKDYVQGMLDSGQAMDLFVQIVDKMGTLNANQLDEYLHYLKATDAEKDYNAALSKQTAKTENASTGCTYCNHCAPCPVGIDIAAVNELLDEVHQNGGVVSEELAAKYKKLEHHAGDCVGCGQCEDRCPFGVPVREKMDEAQAVFGY